ncbi:Uncharacterised protein [Klebsiella pneumoniae]|nr:Uncharacterised protein [Klebsiella pneumoniae]
MFGDLFAPSLKRGRLSMLAFYFEALDSPFQPGW